ncbi:molybdopterin-dependent oxidoreductase [Alicyclobacillus sp. SO9]|uniref:molybdopterin-containing oxidoreductase family protein n=1 Tax=Alicyclobacillus sp. SO9 TaxID=2665646 RepID=UPI0018E6E1F4|nr:molybdopterin-dependent oxidoreductase [Alicyclobacillus sp. SO9]QQE76876.1 molybdopterin-dependent oxidoreductase [Alicyclobacillus sp. SO9]
MNTRYTMCPMNCHPTYCGMKVSVDETGEVHIISNRDHPESKGFLCQRGRNVHEIIDHPRRILHPLQRNSRESAWVQSNWDTIMERLGENLRRPERSAIWMGHGAVVSDVNRPLLFHFADTLGIKIWNPAVVCWGAGAYGLAATGVVETNTKEDVAANAEFILMWGWNVASQPTSAPFVVQAKKRGAQVTAVDCRRSEVQQIADEVLLVKPDSDAALALSMAHVIIREGYLNREFIKKHTVGFDEFAESIESYSPAWASKVTGLSERQIVELAKQYALSPASIIFMGASSMFKGQNGWLASRAIACLPALTGHVGKPGAGFGPRHRGFVKALDYAGLGPVPPSRESLPSHMENMLRVLQSGEIDTLFLFGTNFLSSFADARRVEAALTHVKCIVAHDIVMSRTMKQVADIVLPGTVWIEELGLKATDTYVYLMDKVREPVGQARSIADILSERLGNPQASFQTQKDVVNQLLKGLGKDITADSLRENGGKWPRQAESVGHSSLLFHTPSRKIEFASDLLESFGLARLPVPQFHRSHKTNQEERYPLSLRTGRSGTAFHSFYDEGRMLAKVYERERTPVLWLNTNDANARHIEDGMDVEIFNEKSSFQAKAFVSNSIIEGAVWIRDGWFGINHLTDGISPLPVTASEGLLPIQMPGGVKRIPGGQSSYVAKVDVRLSAPWTVMK